MITGACVPMKDRFIPKTQDKSVISVRLDDVLIANIDELSRAKKISRNELIRQCIEFALERIDDSDKLNTKQ